MAKRAMVTADQAGVDAAAIFAARAFSRWYAGHGQARFCLAFGGVVIMPRARAQSAWRLRYLRELSMAQIGDASKLTSSASY